MAVVVDVVDVIVVVVVYAIVAGETRRAEGC